MIAEFLSTLPFGFQIIMRLRLPWSEKVDGVEFEVHEDVSNFTVRILVPCYNEPLHIIKATVLSAINQVHPEGKLFVYLCDDGNHTELKNWAMEYDTLTYVSRPNSHKGHFKAGNLNYTLRHVVYPEVGDLTDTEDLRTTALLVPRTDILGVLDADMVAQPTMVRDMLQYFSSHPRMMGVQAPQSFHNIDPNADFFDAQNLGFFQYSLPAMGSWNATTCCGTNVLILARALVAAGLYPYDSITEDFGMAVSMHGDLKGKFAYHPHIVATGEAPEDLRQIFQQRSRWAKGNVMVCLKRSVLMNPRLTTIQKLNFASFGWCYVTCAFINPLILFMNIISVWFGIYPVGRVSEFAITVLVCYYGIYTLLIYWTPQIRKHFLSLWVATKTGHFFSYMSMKAIFKVVFSIIFPSKSTISFKVTEKISPNPRLSHSGTSLGSSLKSEEVQVQVESSITSRSIKKIIPVRDSSHSDIVYHWVVLAIVFATILYGCYVNQFSPTKTLQANDERDPESSSIIRLISILWVLEIAIGYSIPLWYAYMPVDINTQNTVLKSLCLFDAAVTLALFTVVIQNASIL